MIKYPYQNLDLKNIKGERWKDIPGLEFYFRVSDYGRIKRLEYALTYSDGRKYIKPEKILKPIVTKIPNRFMNDCIFFLSTGFTLYKQKYNYSLARLVYYCFVNSFNREDDSIVILTKNSNGLNIKFSNLKMASLSEKQKRIFDLNRRVPLFVEGEARARAIANSKLANNKMVTQYNMNGKRIETYPSIVAAANQTGISHSHISNIARGIEFSAGGFIWRQGKALQTDTAPMLLKVEQRRQANKENSGKKVTQYQMNGKRVAIFPTIADASKASGVNMGEISRVMQKTRSSAGGFYWQGEYGPPKIDLSFHKYGEVLRAKNRQRSIEQYTVKGKYIQTFESIKEASGKVGVSSTTISGALSGKQHTAGGCKWKYAKPKSR